MRYQQYEVFVVVNPLLLPAGFTPQIDFPARSCIWLEDRSHHVCFTAKSSKVLNTQGLSNNSPTEPNTNM